MNLFNMLKTMVERSIEKGEDLNHYYAKLDNYLRFNRITQAEYDEIKAMIDEVVKPMVKPDALLIENLVINDSNIVVKNLATNEGEFIAVNGERIALKESGINYLIEGLTHKTKYTLTVARDEDGEVLHSDELLVTTLTKPNPFKIDNATQTHNTITITDRELANNESVYVNWKTYNNVEIVDGAVVIGGLKSETKYAIIVRRDEENGAYANSSAINVTTLAESSEVE